MRRGNALDEIRRLVSEGDWDLTSHAAAPLARGEWTEEDVVCCVMGGRIYKSERDEKGTAVDGKRHVIFGRALGGHRFYVCGKIKRDDEGRLFLVITAHRRE